MKRKVSFRLMSSVVGVFLSICTPAVALLMGTPRNAQGAASVGGTTEKVSVPYQVLMQDADRASWMPLKSLKQEMYVPLTSADQLQKELPLTSIDSESPFPPKELQQINFNHEIGLYLTRGLKGSGGYTCTVSGIERQGQNVYVHLTLKNPQGPADLMMHYRVTLLKIAKADLPVGTFHLIVTDQYGNVLSRRELNHVTQ